VPTNLVWFPRLRSCDRETFLARELKDYLHEEGIATSHSTPYHLTGNAQCERANQTIWKTMQLMLRSRGLRETWDNVLTEALHCVRSLLCTSTNATSHEPFLNFHRRSNARQILPRGLYNQVLCCSGHMYEINVTPSAMKCSYLLLIVATVVLFFFRS